MQKKKKSRCSYGLCFATSEATATGRPCAAMKTSPCSPQLEKAHKKQPRASAVKIKTEEEK